MTFRVISQEGNDRGGQVPDSDHDLIRQAQAGNQSAMSALYVRYRRKVLNYLYRFTGNQDTAEELAQETFVRVVQNLHRYKPIGIVGGWIYRIAGNLALNALRDQPVVPLSLPGQLLLRLKAGTTITWQQVNRSWFSVRPYVVVNLMRGEMIVRTQPGF